MKEGQREVGREVEIKGAREEEKDGRKEVMKIQNSRGKQHNNFINLFY